MKKIEIAVQKYIQEKLNIILKRIKKYNSDNESEKHSRKREYYGTLSTYETNSTKTSSISNKKNHYKSNGPIFMEHNIK